MRRLLPLLLVVLTAGGCMHTAANNAAPNTDAPPDLDSLAYERGVPASAQARVQTQVQPKTPPAAHTAFAADPTQKAAVAVAVVPPPPDLSYHLDTGDKLRIVVFGQDGLSNSYFVD